MTKKHLIFTLVALIVILNIIVLILFLISVPVFSQDAIVAPSLMLGFLFRNSGVGFFYFSGRPEYFKNLLDI